MRGVRKSEVVVLPVTFVGYGKKGILLYIPIEYQDVAEKYRGCKGVALIAVMTCKERGGKEGEEE
jgi:hypothetical protein